MNYGMCMADIQNIGPLPKSTILGFAKGWKIKRGLTLRPTTKRVGRC
jgi:hypothetical protein